MAYEEKYRPEDRVHNMMMEGRKRLSINGVCDVESFDEAMIVAGTVMGILVIRGEGLHIERLSLDSGEILVEGLVTGIEYESEEPKTEGFFSRIFK